MSEDMWQTLRNMALMSTILLLLGTLAVIVLSQYTSIESAMEEFNAVTDEQKEKETPAVNVEYVNQMNVNVGHETTHVVETGQSAIVEVAKYCCLGFIALLVISYLIVSKVLKYKKAELTAESQ